MKYLIILILSSFIVGLAHADKYQIEKVDKYFTWVLNTKTGQVKKCYSNFTDKPECSEWSEKD
jgi:hypothetical protein